MIFFTKTRNNMQNQMFETYRANRAITGATPTELAIYDNYIASNYSKTDVLGLITLRNERSQTASQVELAILDSYILAALSQDPPRMEVLTINTLGSSIKVMSDLNHDTVGTLKQRIASQTGTNPNLVRILKCGRYLEDSRTLLSYHIHKDTTLGFVCRLLCDGGDCCDRQYHAYTEHITTLKMKPFTDLSADEIRRLFLHVSDSTAQEFPLQSTQVPILETPKKMMQNLQTVLSLEPISEATPEKDAEEYEVYNELYE